MSVDLQLDPELVPAPPIDPAALQAGLAAVTAQLDDPRLRRDVCVRICGLAESQALNAAYRDKNEPTNVLSFAADVADLPLEDVPLGDLAICWPVVEQEAREQGKPAADHLTHLFVHGLLHLLGFDHELPAEAAKMEGLEVKILLQLGLTNPYEPCQ